MYPGIKLESALAGKWKRLTIDPKQGIVWCGKLKRHGPFTCDLQTSRRKESNQTRHLVNITKAQSFSHGILRKPTIHQGHRRAPLPALRFRNNLLDPKLLIGMPTGSKAPLPRDIASGSIEASGLSKLRKKTEEIQFLVLL